MTLDPFDYETIQVLMAEYRASQDIVNIRDTWNYIAGIRPLDAREWREWIADDSESAGELYKSATLESSDVELWGDYLDFLLHNEYGRDHVEKELRRATTGPGWHFAQGQKIWERVFGFMIQEFDQDKALEETVRKEFYKRAEMLMDDLSFDNLLVLYSGFETKVGGDYETKMKKFNGLVFKQRKECKKRDVYEQKVQEPTKLEFFKYIEFEKKQKQAQVFSIKSLYERAIGVFPFDVEIWDSYLAFLVSSLRVESVVMGVVKRAIRYCYWEPKIWIHDLVILTMYKSDNGTFNEEIEKAFSFCEGSQNVLDLLFVFLDLFYARRGMSWTSNRIEKEISTLDDHLQAFNKVQQFMAKSNIKDKSCSFLHKFAEFYMEEKEDEENARALFENSVKKSKNANVWLHYIDFEKKVHGRSSPKIRALYKRAMQVKNMDGIELIQKGLLRFELIQNDFNNYYSAYDKICFSMVISPKVEKVLHQMELTESSKRPLESEESPPKKRGKESHDEMQIELDGQKKIEEVKYHIIENLMAGNMLFIPLVNSRVDEEVIRKEFEKNFIIHVGKIVDVLIQPSESGELEILIEFENADQVRAAVSNGPKELQGSPIEIFRCRPNQRVWNFKAKQEDEKIYISNLSPNMEKKTLREAFSGYGKIKEIRLITRKTTAFAYIEFENKNAALKSLEMDQKMLEPPRKISVAISNPAKHAVKQIDDRELYISNLPPSMAGEEDVSTLFTKFGTINQIRVVKAPNGRTTGTAFVTFESVDSAKEALALNGTAVDGRTIIVSIADPNIRSRKKLEKYQDRETSAMFLPRSTLKSKPKAKVQVGSSGSESMQVDSKSQDDFRRMMGIKF